MPYIHYVTEDDLIAAIRDRVSNDAGATEARPSEFDQLP